MYDNKQTEQELTPKTSSTKLMISISKVSLRRFLVVCERGRVIHNAFTHEKQKFNHKKLDGKLDQFFNMLNCTTKVTTVIVFNLKKLENGRYGFSYAHKTMRFWIDRKLP